MLLLVGTVIQTEVSMVRLDAGNFIAAIKTVRTLGQNPRFEIVNNEAGEMVIRPTSQSAPVGLKEAKEFIEEVMAMGVRRYLQDQINDADRKLAERIREREYQARHAEVMAQPRF